MFKNKKVMMLASTDNMIWQFLLPHIEEMQKAGNTVECICKKTGFWFDELQEKYGLKCHNLPFKRNPFYPQNLVAYHKLKKLQKENNYDLIYCQQPVGGLMGRLIGKKFKVPVFYTAHGFFFFKGSGLKKKLLYGTAEKLLARWTDHIVTINDEDFENAKKMRCKNVYKISGIGLDLNKYEKTEFNKENFKKELGVENKKVILTVAEFIKRKNHKTMFKAFEELKYRDDVVYLLCGCGKYKDKFEQYVKDNKLEKKIKFLGYRKDIDKIMQVSDIFLLLSFHEGLTLSIIEAMNFGLPVVCSNVRGNKDLIENEKGGFVVPATDYERTAQKLSYLLDNPTVCEKMGKLNQKNVKQYGIDNVIKELDKIYDEIDFDKKNKKKKNK